jgi:hypothetical protein
LPYRPDTHTAGVIVGDQGLRADIIVNAHEFEIGLGLPVKGDIEITGEDLPLRAVSQLDNMTLGMRCDLHRLPLLGSVIAKAMSRRPARGVVPVTQCLGLESPSEIGGKFAIMHAAARISSLAAIHCEASRSHSAASAFGLLELGKVRQERPFPLRDG